VDPADPDPYSDPVDQDPDSDPDPQHRLWDTFFSRSLLFLF
jgi:hypothetical protein